MKWSAEEEGRLDFDWTGIFANPVGYSLGYNLNVGNAAGSAIYIMNYNTLATNSTFDIPLLTPGKMAHIHIVGVTPAGQFKLYYGAASIPS